jgi:hypothetical protein
VEAACVVVEPLCKSKGLNIVGCYFAPMGMTEVADLKEPKHRALQSLAAALLPAQGFTVCLVFSNANCDKALSVSPSFFRCLKFSAPDSCFSYPIAIFLFRLGL